MNIMHAVRFPLLEKKETSPRERSCDYVECAQMRRRLKQCSKPWTEGCEGLHKLIIASCMSDETCRELKNVLVRECFRSYGNQLSEDCKEFQARIKRLCG